jgi:fructose transport system substrate-binding protein
MKKLPMGHALYIITTTGSAMADGRAISACDRKTDAIRSSSKCANEGAEATFPLLRLASHFALTYAGQVDGDHETQVAAIETCILDGASGVLLTASDTSSIVGAVTQACGPDFWLSSTPLNRLMPLTRHSPPTATFLLVVELANRAAAAAVTAPFCTYRNLDLAVSQ